MNRIATLAAVLVASVTVAACSDDSSSSTKEDERDSGGGALTHVDGTVKVAGAALTVKPANGDATMSFILGPKVSRGTVQALAASNAKGRVFYDPDGGRDPLTAVSVRPAPSAGQGAESYEGRITDVSSSSITIDGDDGERTFPIEAGDREAFDVTHLQEHQAEEEPVRVYYRGSGDAVRAVAYEDA